MKKVSEFLQETNKKISKATVHNYIKEFELGEKSESGKVFLSDIDSQLIEKIWGFLPKATKSIVWMMWLQLVTPLNLA